VVGPTAVCFLNLNDRVLARIFTNATNPPQSAWLPHTEGVTPCSSSITPMKGAGNARAGQALRGSSEFHASVIPTFICAAMAMT
jgi:hypothetical protein